MHATDEAANHAQTTPPQEVPTRLCSSAAETIGRRDTGMQGSRAQGFHSVLVGHRNHRYQSRTARIRVPVATIYDGKGRSLPRFISLVGLLFRRYFTFVRSINYIACSNAVRAVLESTVHWCVLLFNKHAQRVVPVAAIFGERIGPHLTGWLCAGRVTDWLPASSNSDARRTAGRIFSPDSGAVVGRAAVCRLRGGVRHLFWPSWQRRRNVNGGDDTQ